MFCLDNALRSGDLTGCASYLAGVENADLAPLWRQLAERAFADDDIQVTRYSNLTLPCIQGLTIVLIKMNYFVSWLQNVIGKWATRLVHFISMKLWRWRPEREMVTLLLVNHFLSYD